MPEMPEKDTNMSNPQSLMAESSRDWLRPWHLSLGLALFFSLIVAAQWSQLSGQQLGMWALFLVLCIATIQLGGFLLFRKPIRSLEELVQEQSESGSPENITMASSWLHLSETNPNVSDIARFIGLNLQRLEAAEAHLQRSENIFEDLKRDIPIGILEMEEDGTILSCNREGLFVFGEKKGDKQQPREIIGLNLLDFFKEYDRLTCEHSLAQMEINQILQLELQLNADCVASDVMVKFSLRKQEGDNTCYRIAVQDISKLKQLQRRLNQKSDLLNLIVDHVSDALLMTGPNDQILAANRSMIKLMNLDIHTLIGKKYEAEVFWKQLHIEDYQNFLSHIKLSDARPNQPMQQRVDTDAGRMLFSCMPIYDRTEKFQGHLWSITDITNERQKQNLLQQQTRQLLATRRISQQLSGIVNIDDLLMHTTRAIRDCVDIEMVGMALRYHHDWFHLSPDQIQMPDIEPAANRIINHATVEHAAPEEVKPTQRPARDRENHEHQRTRQMLAGPHNHMMWPETGQVMRSVEMHLMSQVMNREQVSLWSDLGTNEPWSVQFQQLGMTSLAGIPIRGAQSAQGILWIAREAGRPVENSQLYLLETLSPIIAARLEVALLFERMNQLQLTDTHTMMPNNEQMAKLTSRWIQAGRQLNVIFIQLNWPGCHYPLGVRHRFIQTLGLDLPRLLRPMDLVAHTGPSEVAIVLSEIDPQDAKEMKPDSKGSDLSGEISIVNRQAIVDKITSRLRNRILLVHEREKRRGNLPAAGLSIATTSLKLPDEADNWLLARDIATRKNSESDDQLKIG